MVTDCEQGFNGPSYTFIDIDETRLVRKTLCEDRDCDAVLRETYDVTSCVRVDTDEELSPHGRTCQELLQTADQQLEDCDESRSIIDIPTAELAHNDLHDDTFSILYEHPDLEKAFLLYFKQTRVTQTQSAPKTL